MFRFFVSLPLLCLVSGCAVSSALSDLAVTAAGAGSGAALGTSPRERAAFSAGGAAVALSAKKYLDHSKKESLSSSFQAGFDAGTAQSVKRHYELIQEQQSQSFSAPVEPPDDSVLLPVHTPKRTINGVVLEESVEYVRVSR